VEKPLATTVEQLAEIEAALAEKGDKAPILSVGFNRRFAPATAAVRKHFEGIASPITISIRFNAGSIDPSHWTQDEVAGGGRIIGEACHAIDLATAIAGSPPIRVYAESVGGPNAPKITDDQCFMTLRHRNGSVSSIAYLAGGDKSYPKERVEVLGGGRLAVIDDWREVTTVANGKSSSSKPWSQDKGYAAELEAFLSAITQGGSAPIPWDDLRGVTLASIFAVMSLREGLPFDLP
jgi:predicted dehydrogenase